MLIRHPEHLRRLRHEFAIHGVDPVQCHYGALLKVPFLVALVKETLRTEMGNKYPLPRYTRSAIYFRNSIIPAKTVVSMTPRLSHENAEVYPDPYRFDPERWLTYSIAQERCFMTFGHGSRTCIGQGVALRVVYRTIAQLASRFDFVIPKGSLEVWLNKGSLEFFPHKSSQAVEVLVEAHHT
ncbi:hypothetical protein E8E11_006596 [Didymella keratinophila]|nr:hypothetical protein E8E11_006596 [Didymella keratinophila]